MAQYVAASTTGRVKQNRERSQQVLRRNFVTMSSATPLLFIF